MKKCPQCGREYDLSMSFCLDDGAELLYGPGSEPPAAVGGQLDEPQTAILHETAPPVEAATRAQIHVTEPRTSLFGQDRLSKQPNTRSPLKPLIASVAVLALLIGGFVAYRYHSSTGSAQIRSIAVLPLQNNSGNADSEYLSDGLAESLIYRLSQLPDLKVSSASSVMRYKGQAVDPKKIAGELGVQAVLSGRLTQRGDNLSISVELIDAATNNTIWGEQYERKMSDLLATQREIAMTISQKLQLKLTGDEKGITKKYTNDNEAYQLYLKGRFQWNKRTISSLKAAVEQYNQAIERDPGFALAYSGLAETYVLFANYEVASAADSMPRAKAAALRALELDDSLAEAHTALAWYYFTYEWDLAAGEKGLRRAIELNREYATAHQWLAELLAQTKRPEEAMVASRRAQEIDPLSPIISFNSGWHHYLTRRYDEAISDFNRTISLYPEFGVAHAGLCWAYERKGDMNSAIPSCRKAAELGGSYERGSLGLALARAGQRDEAARILEELKAEGGRKFVPSIALAIVYMGLGAKESALQYLEKEVAERGYWASTMSVDPVLDELRSEPRFKALLKKMNLPE
jgi:eukaryotic-like serine/threonine-protein kinase